MAIAVQKSIDNAEIADALELLASLLQVEGASPYRVRTYRNAARYIRNVSSNMTDLVQAGEDLSALPTIGRDIARKIETFVKTGRLPLLEDVKRRTPVSLNELMQLDGLGAKRVKLLHDELQVNNLDDLSRVIRSGKLGLLPGFGVKIQQKISASLADWKGSERRFAFRCATDIASPLLDYLNGLPEVERVELAGSYRRRRETVGDLDILVGAKESAAVTDRFVQYEQVAEVVSKDKTRSTVKLRSGIQVDLRVVPLQSYGAALLYLTGSKLHSIALRQRALQRGLKINEYGLFRGQHCVASKTEASLYAALDLDYIEPELRENRGEINAAGNHALPDLIEINNIRGDLHVHTQETDGTSNLRQLAQTALARGYEYLAITDHSQRLRGAHGLTGKNLNRQIRAIDKLNQQLTGITLLKSIEVDILEDGRLDLPDNILKYLDMTVCAIHSKFNLPMAKQTERIIRAMDNPCFSILAHPSGRLINHREPYAVDWAKLMRAARERGCVLEVNAQPERMDLSDDACFIAGNHGVKVAISTDAHSVADLDYMYLGINQARRGWLEAADVVNTRSLPELRALLKRH